MATGYDIQKDKESPTDLCVVCGVDTGIPKETPVYAREYYVEGSGQCCEKCYTEIYA